MEGCIECEGFQFLNNFDSANLAKVESVEDAYRNPTRNNHGKTENNNKTPKVSSTIQSIDCEFNIWTKHDCHGTEFQNNNKTWFHFGVKAPRPGLLVKFNLVNLNKQVKMFSQGMSPVYKVIPGHPQWDRIKDKPTFIANDQTNEFILSFNYLIPENVNAVTYFAFTYPFSYTELQNYLKKIDLKMENCKQNAKLADDIYYHRECAVKSLEGRRLDVLTISSRHNILAEREPRLKHLFPEENEERPFKFRDKKIIFVSARVHPGETPSSFVFNGLLNLLINRDDQIAIVLRRLYVFKLIPMLNPDGVAQGYYRMDTRGVNLNRLYLNPSKENHPTIYAAKALLRYYHKSYLITENCTSKIKNGIDVGTNTTTSADLVYNFEETISVAQSISNETNKLLQRVNQMTLEEKNKCIQQGNQLRNCLLQTSTVKSEEELENEFKSTESEDEIDHRGVFSTNNIKENWQKQENSGIFLYIDLHGHASKKGIFMYGNHFDNPEDSSACMLLPKLMSINNPNFHFTSCNFAEKNMYLVDKRDGMSREGSGRVAVHKLFGLIHSYTLECNYNTGRLVNAVPARAKERFRKIHSQLYVPPKYNPSVFEEVGAAFGPSILDMTGHNPNSRLPNSQYRSLKGLISYLKLISSNRFQSSCNKNRVRKNESQNQSSQEVSGFDDEKILAKWKSLTARSALECSSVEQSELSDSSTSARQTFSASPERSVSKSRIGSAKSSIDSKKYDDDDKKKVKPVPRAHSASKSTTRQQLKKSSPDNDSTAPIAKKSSEKKLKSLPAVRASRSINNVNKTTLASGHRVKRTEMKAVKKPPAAFKVGAKKLADSKKRSSSVLTLFHRSKSTTKKKS